jgi:hypothetical protein
MTPDEYFERELTRLGAEYLAGSAASAQAAMILCTYGERAFPEWLERAIVEGGLAGRPGRGNDPMTRKSLDDRHGARWAMVAFLRRQLNGECPGDMFALYGFHRAPKNVRALAAHMLGCSSKQVERSEALVNEAIAQGQGARFNRWLKSN